MSAVADAPKPKKAAVPKKPAEHPKYAEMVTVAIKTLKERNGSSRQAIEKYLRANYKVGDNVSVHLKQALKRGVASKLLKQVKGTGASGSFKIGEEAKLAKKLTKKPVKTPTKKATTKKSPTKKTSSKRAATPKKPAAKKPAAKKLAAKKPAAKKAKTPAARKPVKKAAKPKKSTTKKSTKKPAAKKA